MSVCLQKDTTGAVGPTPSRPPRLIFNQNKRWFPGDPTLVVFLRLLTDFQTSKSGVPAIATSNRRTPWYLLPPVDALFRVLRRMNLWRMNQN